jgi:hypothetical protein
MWPRVREFNAGGALEQYPGSPGFAQMLLRPQDQLRLFELHPTDHRILASYLGPVKGAEVFDSDGFEGLKGQVPPSTRRGVVLMDPSYEGHGDYPRVIAALRDAIGRFADGVYLVWYPQVTKVEAAELPRRLEALGAEGLAACAPHRAAARQPRLRPRGQRRLRLTRRTRCSDQLARCCPTSPTCSGSTTAPTTCWSSGPAERREASAAVRASTRLPAPGRRRSDSTAQRLSGSAAAAPGLPAQWLSGSTPRPCLSG